ncbi:hypothetical protein [Clostridium butyricum]|uniref:hypothetical protein n=1 Tax=Clostridium butyricum TaxID=1492 RepID=UPI00346677AE
MEEEKFVSLNSIISYLYKRENNLDKIEYFENKDYKKFAKSKNRETKKICKALDIDLDAYKDNKNTVKSNKHTEYKIPYMLGEILKVYLMMDSSNGSTISKIKNEKVNKVTIGEKIQLINEMIKFLEKNNNDPDFKMVVKYLHDKCLVEALAEEELKKITEFNECVVNEFMELMIYKISNMKENSGFIKLEQIKEPNLKKLVHTKAILKFIDTIKDTTALKKEYLTINDRILLSKYFLSWIIDNMKEFFCVIENFAEVREDDVSQNSRDNYASSESVLDEALEMYRSKIKRELIPKKLPPDNMKQIMEEIKLKIKKEKNS